jgi:Fe-S cluster assembly ATPase SufC
LINGQVIRSGGKELAHELEAKGYAPFETKPKEAVSA